MTELPDWALSNIEEGCGPLYSLFGDQRRGVRLYSLVKERKGELCEIAERGR
jgi:hypothetical protein